MQEELRLLIVKAQSGELAAFDEIVARFQDVAVAYASSVLGDKSRAEDAAQEAFIEAFFCLPSLEEPAAFAGWLRRIVFKQCDRLTRKKQVVSVSLQMALEEPAAERGPQASLEAKANRALVREAIAKLPEHQRTVVMLFYMGQHSQLQIAEFLEVPVTTIKKRLYSARQRLKGEMIGMIEENLEGQRPSKNPQFAEKVQSFTGQFSRMIDGGQSIVRSLAVLAEDRRNVDLSDVIAQVRHDITGNGREGATLSEALAKHPAVFSREYVEAIRRGEGEGNLAVVLRELRGY